jgi:hypothetical protein
MVSAHLTVSTLHFWAALVAIGVDLVLVVVTVIGVATRQWNRLVGDRLVLAALGATGLAALLGAGSVVTSRPPSDALHIVYGVVALAVLPIARYIGRAGSDRRRAAWLALGSAVQLAVFVRLLQTGGT